MITYVSYCSKFSFFNHLRGSFIIPSPQQLTTFSVSNWSQYLLQISSESKFFLFRELSRPRNKRQSSKIILVRQVDQDIPPKLYQFLRALNGELRSSVVPMQERTLPIGQVRRLFHPFLRCKECSSDHTSHLL